MRLIKETILFLSTLAFLGCDRKITSEEFEQDVFDKLFIAIVDSTYIDQRLYTCFPEQGKPIYDEKGKWIGLDSVGQHRRDLECEVKRSKLKKDTLNLIIVIENGGLINEKTDLNQYKTPKFTFKHLSEHPRGRDLEYKNWKANYPKFAGVMSFSHVKFNSEKTSGSLEVSYSCGGKCGLGYSVYIRKVNDKWVIVKVDKTWIS